MGTKLRKRFAAAAAVNAAVVGAAIALSAAPAHAANVYYTLTNQGTAKCLTGSPTTISVATCKTATYTQEWYRPGNTGYEWKNRSNGLCLSLNVDSSTGIVIPATCDTTNNNTAEWFAWGGVDVLENGRNLLWMYAGGAGNTQVLTGGATYVVPTAPAYLWRQQPVVD